MELSLDRLTKHYGNKIAVDCVSATLKPGVYGLLGANGAGKTTLMRMLCAILESTSGEVLLNGKEVTSMGADYRNVLGYLPQDFGYYPNYTAMEFLMYVAALKGIPKDIAKKRANELLEVVGLSHVANKKVKTFSGGMKQRVGIAQALLNNPGILILDEPTAGLDPKERVRFRNLLSEYAGDKIVILSTHIVSDVEAIADEVLLMKKGKFVLQGTVQELTEKANGKVWELTVSPAEASKWQAKTTVANLRHEGKTLYCGLFQTICLVSKQFRVKLLWKTFIYIISRQKKGDSRMELFLLEHKKLWRKRIVKICVLLCFIYIVIFGSILSFQWFSFGSSDDYTSAFGNNFDGYGMIKESQEYALVFGEELTDETLQQLVRDYQRMEAAGMEKELEKTDWKIINSWLATLYPELRDTGTYQTMISYVDPNKLTGFYERREQAINDFLENSGQTGVEKEYLFQMEQEVESPLQYGWVEGWSQLLGSMVADLGVVMALFLAIALSPLFAGEWHDNTSSLVLTTKNGWGKVASAKIVTGLVFTIEFFLMLAIPNVVSQIFFMGTSGWDMPIQNIKLIAIAPMNMLQAEIYEYAFALLGAIGFAGVVMFISATVKNNVLALLFSLACVYGPMMIAEYLPYELQKVLDLLPLVGSGADIFRTNTFHIFGKYVWSPYLLVTVPVMIGICCMPFAIRNWSRRLKA